VGSRRSAFGQLWTSVSFDSRRQSVLVPPSNKQFINIGDDIGVQLSPMKLIPSLSERSTSIEPANRVVELKSFPGREFFDVEDELHAILPLRQQIRMDGIASGGSKPPCSTKTFTNGFVVTSPNDSDALNKSSLSRLSVARIYNRFRDTSARDWRTARRSASRV